MSDTKTRRESAKLLAYLSSAPHSRRTFLDLQESAPDRRKYLPTRRAPQNLPAPHGRTLSGLPIGGAR